MSNNPFSAYLAAIGAKGGKVKGRSKRRGNAAYYRALATKSAQSRRKHAAGQKAK